jgi:outer membrane receptor for ferrienterochelin and colicins
VANVFTEDHAALTGSRSVVFQEKLKPERSWNVNLNALKSFRSAKGYYEIELSAFYTRFGNKIVADYLTDANKVIYTNLDGYAISRGFSANFIAELKNGFRATAGGTFMDVFSVESEQRRQQLFTEKLTGTWSISQRLRKLGLVIDYTGNFYSPMKLPLLGPLDPRPQYSPWWSIQNIQLTKSFGKRFEIYGGVKNILNWTPGKRSAFLIARAGDPFDKNVQFDPAGQAISTPDNPYALTFDPSYVYGPNQGIRGFLGARFTVK